MRPMREGENCCPPSSAESTKENNSGRQTSLFSFLFFMQVVIIIINTRHACWRRGQHEAPPPLSVTGQPLDGAPAVVHVLQFCFHSSSPGCLWSTMLPLSLWGPVDCNFSDGVGILMQHVPNPVPLLSGDDGLRVVLQAPC